MTGYTDAQIRASIVALLQANATITGTVPSARIFNGRLLALTDDLDVPAIRVYSHQVGSEWAGDALTPIFWAMVDVVVELYVTATTDAALEVALDFDQTILTAILQNQVWTSTVGVEVPRYATMRSMGNNGDRRLAMAKTVITLKTPRSYL